MQNPIVVAIMIVVAITVTALVTIAVTAQVTGNVDEIKKQSDAVYKLTDIKSQSLCEAVGGAWKNDKCE